MTTLPKSGAVHAAKSEDREAAVASYGELAALHPDKPALLMDDGSAGLTFAELHAKSWHLCRCMAGLGLRPGDTIALLLDNGAPFIIGLVAASRMGLNYTPINNHLTAAEIEYILDDCGAKLLLTDLVHLPEETYASEPRRAIWIADGAGSASFAPLHGSMPDPAEFIECSGASLPYTSGTSGKPKGVRRSQATRPVTALTLSDKMMRGRYGFNANTVFLVTAPLYHAAPMGQSLAALRCGATVILMHRFDALVWLRLVAVHQVTATWMVPTMFTRLLRLPERIRHAADVSSLTHVIHGAAPCAVDVKQAMIDWLGFVVYEFYSASEGMGLVAITSEEWLSHPGSVGHTSNVRIVREDGSLAKPGEIGEIYFIAPQATFSYLNDPEKTAAAFNADGWGTIGDMGYLDADGWLYLTDRKANMIISGGVNIYPQEAENVLVTHPEVADVAVIGRPDLEYGEVVMALVVPTHNGRAGEPLARQLTEWCQERLARYKCPRSIEFVASLPRSPTGKLAKGALQERYKTFARASRRFG